MADESGGRRDTIINTALTAALLLGLVILLRWFVLSIGGDLDKGTLILGMGLVIGSTAIRLVR